MYGDDQRQQRTKHDPVGWSHDDERSHQLTRAQALLIAVLLTVAGCSGGGGGAGSVPTGNGAANGALSSAVFTVVVPKNISPQYVSPNTGSLRINYVSVNGLPPSPAIPDTIVQLSSGVGGCTASSSSLTCTVTIPAPVGSDVLAVTIYQSSNATGAALATNNLTVTVVANTANQLNITLGGVVSTIVLSPNPMVAPADGAMHTLSLSVTAKDASGATIIAPGNYSSPINLAVTGDPNGAIRLSSSQVTAPSSNGTNSVTVTYDASKALTSATVTASASGATLANVNVNPIVYSPANLNSLYVGGGNGTLTVSEAGYSGAFTVGGNGSLANVSCSPVSCAPTSSGGIVTVTVTPNSAGSGTLTLTDTHSVAASVSLKVASSSTGIGIPGPPVVTEFSNGITAPTFDISYVTAGPDGNVWFTENQAAKVGRITPSGVVTEFSNGISGGTILFGITSGPDGNLWFAEAAGVTGLGRITPSGTVTEFSNGVSPGSEIVAITSGPDGNLWFVEDSPDRVGRMTTSGVGTEFTAGISSGADLLDITSGPDGNLWFVENGTDKIGRITPSGAVTEFSTTAGSSLTSITSGADGNLWFVEQGLSRIGRITPSGTITEFSNGITSSAGLEDITSGPDGNLWFTENRGSRNRLGARQAVGRITPSGAVTEFTSGIDITAGLFGITTGPDGNLWFAERDISKVGRLQP